MQTIPYSREQAAQLLETGKCQLPVDWSDIANRVAKMDNFSYALRRFNEGQPRMMQMLVMTAANTLCQEQDNEL